MVIRRVNCPDDATEGWERPEKFSSPLPERDAKFLKDEITNMAVKTILEFGPGVTTELFSTYKDVKVTSCEHVDKFYEGYKERFKDNKNVRILKYHNELPVVVEGLNPAERFDMGFVDSPAGYPPLRKVFPGVEDCSRLNTVLFALERCKFVLLHDANRPCERGTLGRLSGMGYDYHFLTQLLVAIFHGDSYRPDLSRPPQFGGTPPRADSEQRGVSVDLGHNRLDGSGAGKKGHRVRKGRRQSGGGVRSSSGSHHSVESSPGVRSGKRSGSRRPRNSGGDASAKDGFHATDAQTSAD